VDVAPPQVSPIHRAIGAAAILLTIPIAYHCAFAYGVQTGIETRVAVHSIAGCFIYGALLAPKEIASCHHLRPLGVLQRTFWPPAEGQSVCMCPGASAASCVSTAVDDPDREDDASGTKAVPAV
jgi:hypothetical protein